jgi:hypothetical protein
MLLERWRPVSGVWWSGSLGAETITWGRRGYSPPRLACMGSGSKRAVVFARFAAYRVGPYTSIECSQTVQTSAPHPSKEGKGNRRGGVAFEPIWYLSKVRWARNERFEFNTYSTNFF